MMNLQTSLTIPIVLERWLREGLVDPVSKRDFLSMDEQEFCAQCGIVYGFKRNIPDFRVRITGTREEWLKGQSQFEQWVEHYYEKGEKDPFFYQREQERDAPMYTRFPLTGRVLDVGGQLGYIRKYLSTSEYCVIDPFIDVPLKAEGRARLFDAYELGRPLNFVGGFAEMLPFRDMYFDSVNMRSCLDHFFNPELALLEAFRVLKPGGKLVIGLSLHESDIKEKVKDTVKGMLALIASRFEDEHIWHPTYDGLMAMVESCGFQLEDEAWQSTTVLYAQFSRQSNLRLAT